ncbi:MAG: 50S ribosomal protein L11 methyltransferase [Coxiellaceae bacterium]|nr:50S ribosomal protein L11 methyltransferase [Coxiellaceae bacterium]
MTNLIQISATISPEHIDLLSELFFALDAETVTLTDAKDEPLFQLSPEDQPHWQQTTVHGLFALDEASFAQRIVTTIKENNSEFVETKFIIQEVENKNWVEETQKQFHAQAFGPLWVCPQWEKEVFLKNHPNEKVIFIEPGLAFGTGTHPTTQLCLTWLATHDLKNKTVVDYGCGSGILALAACAEDAALVYATDHDQQALESTLNNAEYNVFPHAILHTRKTNDMSDVKADIVVANILANTLITLAPTLIDLLAPNGKLILSGVLSQDVDRVVASYSDHFSLTDVQHQEEWTLIALSN